MEEMDKKSNLIKYNNGGLQTNKVHNRSRDKKVKRKHQSLIITENFLDLQTKKSKNKADYHPSKYIK